jgi:uncharacterized membrane protein YdjX (TVP38/TMEM64 family)
MEPPRLPDSLEVSTSVREGEDKQVSLTILLGARPDMPDRSEYLLFLTASGIVLLLTLAFLGYIFLEPVRRDLYDTVLEPERLRAAVDYLGYWGPLVLILVQAVQVLLMVWPVPMELASGFLFGMPLGFLYSTLGHVLGSALAFLLGRWLEKRYISRLLGPDKMGLLRGLLKREGALAGFLIFLIPGFPKDFICYLFGLTRISLAFFLAATTLARLPGTLLFTYQGAQVYKGHYGFLVGFLCLYAGLAFLLYKHREAFYRWLNRWHLEDD